MALLKSALAVSYLWLALRAYMTGTLRSWLHYIDLRTEKSTQKEHRDIAKQCKVIFREHFPVIAEAAWQDGKEDPRNDEDYDTYTYGIEPLPNDTTWSHQDEGILSNSDELSKRQEKAWNVTNNGIPSILMFLERLRGMILMTTH